MKAIKLTHTQWNQILQSLHEEYPPSYFLRWKMKEKLGFTVREHKAWIENKEYKKQHQLWSAGDPNNIMHSLAEPWPGKTEQQIHLDFYSETKRSFFLLKFSEIISKEINNENDLF